MSSLSPTSNGSLEMDSTPAQQFKVCFEERWLRTPRVWVCGGWKYFHEAETKRRTTRDGCGYHQMHGNAMRAMRCTATRE
eukprot:2538300-Lingulodinium_polyedra.AAC.1